MQIRRFLRAAAAATTAVAQDKSGWPKSLTLATASVGGPISSMVAWSPRC